MRAAIIGAGLGGLLAANLLAKEGYKVDVFEKLPFIGGRFTNLTYKGFELSTGALHMIPHGKRGPLGSLLKELKVDVEIKDSKPEGEALYNDKREILTKKVAPFKTLMKFYAKSLIHKFFGRDFYLNEFQKGIDEFSGKFIDAFLGWSLSITSREILFSKFLKIYQQTMRFRGPGIPIGGCKAVIDGLVENLKSYDGKIHLRKKVEGIVVESAKAKGVIVKNERIDCDLVISNVGHYETQKLVGKDYLGYLKMKLSESSGIKYSIALNEPFIGHSGVLFTLDAQRIAGLNEVTNADPNLAPNGKHLLMAHQPMLTSNVKYEISLGLKDLKRILNGYNYEILVVQSYTDGWPVNRVKAGMDIGVETPYTNLFVVGDGAKGDDIEVDGIALGVLRFGELI
ncbi:NAD(P)/FAD-dependent oxidoreductase [Archaeoglobales archaeon]|nr:MAG: NAD(P)/FAD-dependent oxidoreductase [Archaeoglobales archaeon]